MFHSLHFRIFSILFIRKRVAIFAIASFATIVLLAACQFGPPAISDPTGSNQSGVSVQLQIHSMVLAKSASAPLPTDSAIVQVSAPDMDSHVFRFGSGVDNYSLGDLTPGSKRHFSIQLFSQGRLLYIGSADTTLYTDRKNTVFLRCVPQFSRLSSSVHVPLDFPRKVGRSELRIWNNTDTLIAGPDQPGEFLNFHLENVPGDRNYHLKFSLWDDTGALAATSVKDTLWVAMGQSIALNLPLVTTFSQMQLNLNVTDPQQTSVSFSFPAAKRVPAAFGEIVFSEVYLSPTSQDSSSQGQWLELYNRTSDTLDVSSCKVMRDGGGSTSKQAIMATGTLVPPGRGLVVGRSAYPNADVRFSSFSLGTGLSHVNLSCKSGALQLDSMTYSLSTLDSAAVQTVTGKISQLRPDWVGQRTDPRGWCQVPSHPVSTSEGWPTPHTLENGCPQ